ncbi:hypothetical protein ACFY3G_17730 [Streptomyces phaeochromogenes]|uniref:hypothetical protein n=1 Tax=Streptomyces phaeochromogenes TaxID=1923 RepID=UPI0036A8B636
MPDTTTRALPSRLAAVPRLTVTYSRHAWERAVLDSDLHPHAKLLGLVLAHHAGDSGYLPPGHVQDARRLAPEVGLTGRFTRMSLNVLQVEGYVTRPPIEEWREELPRPVTLTLPSHNRRRPPHTGEQP